MTHDPIDRLLLAVLALVSGVVAVVFLLGGVEYAYQRIGISAQAMFGLIFAELAGSAVNIPIKRLPAEPEQSVQDVQLFGMRFRLPVAREQTTAIAVNLGGAVIPTAVSVYLLVGTRSGRRPRSGSSS